MNKPIPNRRPPASPPTPATTTAAPRPDALARAAIMQTLARIEPGSREFEFTEADFERVRRLIYKRAGISLSPVKQDMVYSRLARRLRLGGHKRFVDYLDKLENSHDAAEWEAFVNALTTNLTSFFREAHHFDILSEHLRRVAEKRTLRIWCCASSTGEEAYSLAITACEMFAGMNPPVEIVASDLDTNVLAHGQKGVYGADRLARMEEARINRFFVREASGDYRVRPELQRMINFRRINLLESNWPLQGPFDAIFCRNVMIYFDKPTQYRILERFVPLLRPDGLLFAGHSENFIHAANLFRSMGRTVYARTPAAR
ncbi:CheR family methyltransferase [Uliginosibacterium sp. sgz301328]|uniref:CheR family methyltransferase n=1 Tax=Uliginosibacterium sp. sgz301328 TaxID=3243764 RepID=UPI00359DB2AD